MSSSSDEEFYIMSSEDDSGGSSAGSSGSEEMSPDIMITNAYDRAVSALRDNENDEALEGLLQVIELSPQFPDSDWAFKAHEALVKVYYSLGQTEKSIESLVAFVDQVDSSSYDNVTRMFDWLTRTVDDLDILRRVFGTVIDMLLPKSDTLWFKASIKFAKILLDYEDYTQFLQIIKILKPYCVGEDGDIRRPSNLLEVYSLEILMFTAQRDLKKLKELYEKAETIESGVNTPRVTAIIKECGGKMHLTEGSFDLASACFFSAFKHYTDASDSRNMMCLQYLVLSNMLMDSDVDPFKSQEAAAYKNNPEMQALITLLNAYQRFDLFTFEKTLKKNRKAFMEDPFMSRYLTDIRRAVRTHVLMQKIKPYTRVNIAYLSDVLDVPVGDIGSLLVALILDNKIRGRIDQVEGRLELSSADQSFARYDAISQWTRQISRINTTLVNKVS